MSDNQVIKKQKGNYRKFLLKNKYVVDNSERNEDKLTSTYNHMTKNLRKYYIKVTRTKYHIAKKQ